MDWKIAPPTPGRSIDGGAGDPCALARAEGTGKDPDGDLDQERAGEQDRADRHCGGERVCDGDAHGGVAVRVQRVAVAEVAC